MYHLGYKQYYLKTEKKNKFMANSGINPLPFDPLYGL